MNRWVRTVGGVGLLLCVVLVLPAAAQRDRGSDNIRLVDGVVVDPDSLWFTITCSETAIDSLCITTPPSGGIRAADILFIMDITGSMAAELDTVKTSVVDIMHAIEDMGIDAAYGVGTIADYPHPYNSCGYDDVYGTEHDFAWHMDQDITTNTAAIEAAVAALSAKNGWDLPENYARALYECQFFDFRADTKKIILMFGDAPVHDCDFLLNEFGWAQTYGWDPGRNEIMENGLGDDLDYESVVADLALAGFTILTLDSSGQAPGGSGAWENFEYMAMQTSGGHYLLEDAGQIPDAILELIGEVAVIDEMTIEVSPDDPAYASWLATVPDMIPEVHPETEVCFEIQITAIGTPVGIHTFDLVVMGDGDVLATVPVTVNVTGASAVEPTTWSRLRSKYREPHE